MTLAELPVGGDGVIASIEGDRLLARRLFDLGFRPGLTVGVERVAPLGDPRVYRVSDTDVALRREQAELIRMVGAA